MKRLEEAPALAGIHVIYADLDGTILGPGGSLFAGSDGTSLAAAEALARLRGSETSLVVMSGRTRRSGEVARILGADAYICELGALIIERPGLDEEVVQNFGAFPGNGSPYDAIVRSGAAAFLLDRFAGRLLPVAPWAEATMQLHGLVDAAEATEDLAAAGYGWLELQDNGRLRRTYVGLEIPQVRAYHLLPRGVSKASAVRVHRERHGIAREEAVAIGDSPADLDVAPEVAAFFLVANGAHDAGTVSRENAYLTRGERGEGFAEAVATVLA